MPETPLKCYIVTFETASDDVRAKVRERLKAYGRYCPIHKYCWAILTTEKATEIRDHVGQVMSPSDRLFVIRSGTVAAWRNPYSQKNSEWLKKNL